MQKYSHAWLHTSKIGQWSNNSVSCQSGKSYDWKLQHPLGSPVWLGIKMPAPTSFKMTWAIGIKFFIWYFHKDTFRCQHCNYLLECFCVYNTTAIKATRSWKKTSNQLWWLVICQLDTICKRKGSIRFACGTFSWLIADVGRSSSLWRMLWLG